MPAALRILEGSKDNGDLNYIDRGCLLTAVRAGKRAGLKPIRLRKPRTAATHKQEDVGNGRAQKLTADGTEGQDRDNYTDV